MSPRTPPAPATRPADDSDDDGAIDRCGLSRHGRRTLRLRGLGLGLGLGLFGCSLLACSQTAPGAADLGVSVDDAACRGPGAAVSAGCDGYRAKGSLGKLPSDVLDETSGAAASRKNRDVLWVHNDSGGEAELYALAVTAGTAPRLIATVALTGAKNEDWEDLAIGPSPRAAGDFLYVGDIGDNVTSSKRRSGIQVYRIPEPALDTTKTGQRLTIGAAQVERIELVYPGGQPHDSEAMFVDPQSGEIFLITKNLSGPSFLYSAGAISAPTESPIELRPAAGCDGTPRPLSFAGGSPIVTGADLTVTGRAVLVRAYSGAFLFERGPTESVFDALARTACELPIADERQGETIAATADGTGYFTVSEGKGEEIHLFMKE